MVGKKGDVTCGQKISLWCLQLLLGLRDRLGDRIQRCLGRWIVRDSAWALGKAPSYPGKQRGPHGPCSELLSFMELTDVDLGLRVPYWDSSSKTGLCTHLSWLSIFKPKGQSVSEVAQSCPTLCNPTDCSLPGSSIHGIFQVRVLEWVSISFSRGSSRPRDRTWFSCVSGGFCYIYNSCFKVFVC